MAAAHDVEEVSNDGARRRGNHADSTWKRRQWPLAIGVEEAFGFEPLPQLFKGKLQRSGADRFHGFADQLQLAALLVDAYPAPHQHMESVRGTKTKQQRLTPEKHHRQLSLSVFQGEVKVTGGRWPQIGNLAFDPHIAVSLLDQFPHLLDQFAHRPDTPRRLRLLKGEIELARRWILQGHQ